MKKIFTLLLLNCINSAAFCQVWDWTKTGGVSETVSSMAIDGQQFFITALYGSVSPAGNIYGILNKRDRNGNLVWQKKFAAESSLFSNYSSGIWGVVTDQQGNIYTSNDSYDSVNQVYTGRRGAVCKYDFNGNLLWTKELCWIDGSNERIDISSSAIAKDEQDNIYVTGIAGPTSGISYSPYKKILFGSDTVTVTNPGSCLVVAKLDKNGQKIWLKTFLYTKASNNVHRTGITSVAVKNGQVAIAGTSNLTSIYFDSTLIYGGRGTNFLTLLNAADGSVKWVKNITFNGISPSCVSSCDAPAARVVYSNNDKLVFTSAFMDTLNFGGIRYNANNKRQYYISRYDTAGAEEFFKILPNDAQGSGMPNSYHPFYQAPALTKAGNHYFLHVLSHLYKMDSAYNILWTSTNDLWTLYGTYYHHTVLAADPSGNIIGQGSNFNGATTMAGNEVITNPGYPYSLGYYSRINKDYNIVSGYMFYDANNNGIKDPGELPAKNQLVGVPAGNRFFALTDSTGLYECLTDTGSFTFAPINPPVYHTVTPAGHSITMNSFNQHISNKNFALALMPNVRDLSIDLTGITSNNRPGFSGYCSATIFNKGTATQSGSFTVRLSPHLQYTQATPPPAAVYPDSLVFSYSNFAPGSSRYYTIQYQIKPSAIFGDSLISYARIEPVATDTVKHDNYDTLRQIVRGAYDPNDKEVSLSGNVSYDRRNEKLEYTIRFQNTGNDTAFNVRIMDTLSAKLDVSSFELVSSSHRVQPALTEGRVVTFYFDNILLVDSNQNEPLSHGMVKFRIKPLAGLQLNDSITNRCSIYFDYNAPVLTNTVKTKYAGYPTVNLGSDISVCGGPVNLNAGNAGARFVWSTGDTVQRISVSSSGTYWVRVTNSYGLSASDTINVVLKPLPLVNLGADITQCGGSVTLNATNPGSSYLWSNGATAQSITITASGIYGVRVTNADGCFKSDTIQVTIHPLPTVNLGADITQCGGSVILNAANPGSSYLWSTGATAQSISGSASGMYSVKVTNVNGCFKSDTIQITINPLPTVNLGADIVQCGGSVTLNAANPGSSYLWSNGATTQTINVTASGIYHVKVTNASGCAKADTVQVTINPVPVVNLGADAGFCAGSTVLLDVGNAGAAYLWNTGATSRQLTVSQGGQYSVRVTNTAGCAAADTIQLTQRALPVVQLNLPDTLFAGDVPVAALVQPAGGQFTGTGMTNGRFDAAVAGQGRHTVRYSYTDAFGCSSQASATVVVLAAVDKVKVYPNPSRGNFTVVAGRALRNGNLTIVTPSGQVMGRFALTAFVQQVRISLPPGAYYLRFSNNGITETRRMLVL